MDSIFTAPDAWSGGAYELALQYGSRSLSITDAALRALWTAPNVGQCYLRKDVEPEEQHAVELADFRGMIETLYGACVLRNSIRVAAHSQVIPYDDGPFWVYFGFPMGSLGRAYPVGAYPFGDGSSLAWRDHVDDWLRALASHVFYSVPFDCALIGHEPEESIADDLVSGVPERRWEGILLRRGTSLEWFPPTERYPFTFPRSGNDG